MIRPILNKRPAKIPFTKTGYEKIVAEYEGYIKQRPDAVLNLKLAREMGDLSENGYYKAARARLSSIDANLRRLDRIIKNAKIVEHFNTGSVEIGSTVELVSNGKTVRYMIVGGYESDPANHTISHLSPLGKAVIGKTTGTVVCVSTPRGIISHTIVSVS